MTESRPQWEDCKVCGGDHWTKDHPARAEPPIGYWCCADDWNAGSFRTGDCIGRTQNPDPEWVRIRASDSPEKTT